MSSYEHLDLLLGQALECIDDADGEIKGLSVFNQKDLLMKIGRSIAELWEVRNAVYEAKPEIKRDFVQEYKQDKARYERLSEIHKKAFTAEKSGEIDIADSAYRELLDSSSFGYFQLLAQAGLYRLTKIDK